MEYSHFSIGSLEPYNNNANGKVMTLVTIKSKLTLRELNAILGKRSGVQVVAHRGKPSTCDLCTQADHFSEQAIFDLLRDLEFLLKQRDRARQREAMRGGRRSGYANDPRRSSKV
ncbi:hypothetical protein HY003_01560 [Candidatus Saccharibacteria bacterium]|nr:hypothetical protein [Candidatus Saccharibacteria bacterium]MBI3337962.1 hypothetical protein [Candidatus Saccharibacteria bacterium]